MQTDRLEALLSRFRVSARLFHSGPLCGVNDFAPEQGRGQLHLLRRRRAAGRKPGRLGARGRRTQPAVLSAPARAQTLDPDIARDPPDPWYVLPWGFAKLHLAELEAADGNTGAAKSFLAEALPRLEAVRGDAQGDQWDEPAFRAGVELQQRLRGANR